MAFYEKHAKRYWLAYFGKRKIEELTHSFVQGNWNWRHFFKSRADNKCGNTKRYQQGRNKPCFDLDFCNA